MIWASGEDALLERVSDGSYRLTRMRPARSIDAEPTSVTLARVRTQLPALDLDEAIERISADGERLVFFENATTGRGNVLYRRYDGHYGLIAPE